MRATVDLESDHSVLRVHPEGRSAASRTLGITAEKWRGQRVSAQPSVVSVSGARTALQLLLEAPALRRGSSFGSTYSSPRGPIALTCVRYSPDLAQWKWDVSPGRTSTAPGG